jgi:hypothetical protein
METQAFQKYGQHLNQRNKTLIHSNGYQTYTNNQKNLKTKQKLQKKPTPVMPEKYATQG